MGRSFRTFGDVRLDKRGRKSSNGCRRVKRCACASWPATARVSCRLGGLFASPRVTAAKLVAGWSHLPARPVPGGMSWRSRTGPDVIRGSERGEVPDHGTAPPRSRPGREGERIRRAGARNDCDATDQAQTRSARGVHRDHCVHQHAVCVSLTHRAEVATALRRGRELHLTSVPGSRPGQALDRQDMPPGTGRAGQIGPARNQLCRRHSRAGEEPPGLQLTLAVAAQLAQAHRFTRRHPFEDLRPLLSRRTSPNVPNDNSIAAPVGRLPQGSESFSRRVAQAKKSGRFRIRFYMCACPSAKAGTQLLRGDDGRAALSAAWYESLRLRLARRSHSATPPTSNRPWVCAFVTKRDYRRMRSNTAKSPGSYEAKVTG